MISIIIPVYNVEQYLQECLDSILSQTYSDFEVILVDDGSPDNSGMICDEYARKNDRIRVIHQKNSGVSAARNKGLDNAKGEWVTFVDSDDWLNSDFLASFQLSDDIDISVTGLCYMRCPERLEIRTWKFEEKIISLSKDFADIANNNLLEFGTVCCKAYKRQIIEAYKIRFDTSFSYHEDHLFFLQYLQHIDKVYLHRAISYNYRITYLGVSLSSKIHPWENLNRSGDKMFYELKRFPYIDNLPKWYIKKIATFCLAPKIRACQAIIEYDITNKEKRKVFNHILKDRNILRGYYHPLGLKKQIQKNCLLGGYNAFTIYCCLINLLKRMIKR